MDRQLLSDSLKEALNYRIQQEEWSARLYDYMSLWLENKGYFNIAKLYKNYADEERSHSCWAKDFLLSYGITPELRGLPSPVMEFESCTDILEETLTHELAIQKQCEELAINALQEKSIVVHTLALKYCQEQIDEVAKALDLLDAKALTEDMLVFDQYVGNNLMS